MKKVNVKSKATRSAVWLCDPSSYSLLAGHGYVQLSQCPEIQAGMIAIADLISVMTIHLMENGKEGDKRIKNELSRKVDINPCKYTNRKNWVYGIVIDLLERGNSVHVPHYSGTFLDDIEPLDMDRVSIRSPGYGYIITAGDRMFDPDEILHFTYNPDPKKPWIGRGITLMLQDVAQSLAQSRKTAGALMASPKPSIIVKVDGLSEDFASKEGREKLRHQYLDSSDAGEPWFIPAEAFEVDQVKPLSIADLAIPDSIKIDKRTAAALLGVPPFVVGEGEFDAEEFNNFIRSKLLPIARGIEQELTKKLLLSDKWFFRFNPRSLYAYSMSELAEVCCNLVDRAIIDRNEARDAMGYTPRDGLSELAILENFIPYAKIGDQKKLKEKGGEGDNA